MVNALKKLLLLLPLSAPVMAQISNPSIIPQASLPASCTNGNLPTWLTPTAMYICLGGVPTALSTSAAAGVSSLTGDGTIISNSGSTGAVTLTLANTPTGTGGIVLATSPTLVTPTLVTPALGTPASGVITNLTGTCTACTANVASSVTNALTLNNSNTGAASGTTYNGSAAVTLSANTLGAGSLANSNTWTAAQTNSTNGAASTSPMAYTGALFTGGTGTTTFPQVIISPSGAVAETGWSTNGTFFGINSASGFNGNFVDFHLNNAASAFKISSAGAVNAGAYSLLSGTNVLNTSGIQANAYLTATNCAAVGTAASPSVVSCSAAPAGAFSCATNASAATCTINTTIVTANSEIFVQEVADEGTRLSVTCNTAPTVTPAILLATKTAGTGFTINMPTITTNPACFNFWIVN